jgi:hypothetical protein
LASKATRRPSTRPTTGIVSQFIEVMQRRLVQSETAYVRGLVGKLDRRPTYHRWYAENLLSRDGYHDLLGLTLVM